MRKALGRIALVAMVAVLAGCATAPNNLTQDPKRAVGVLCTDGPCTTEQRALAGTILIEAGKFVEAEMSGRGQSVATRGLAGALAGGVATALSANPLSGSIMWIAIASGGFGAIPEGDAVHYYAWVSAVSDTASALREDGMKLKKEGYEKLEYVRFITFFAPATKGMNEFLAPDKTDPPQTGDRVTPPKPVTRVWQ